MIPIDEQNLGNLVLTDRANTMNQFIYQSQLYETSFGVYANIAYGADGISSVKLIILNYKGTIDLGFHNSVLPKCSLVSQVQNNKKIHILHLTFEVRAAVSEATTYTSDVELDANLGDIVNIPATEKTYLFVERSVAPMWSDSKKPLHQGVFDQEFFYRDGIRFLPKVVYEIPDNIYNGNTGRVYPNETIFHSPSFKCRNSILLVTKG